MHMFVFFLILIDYYYGNHVIGDESKVVEQGVLSQKEVSNIVGSFVMDKNKELEFNGLIDMATNLVKRYVSPTTIDLLVLIVFKYNLLFFRDSFNVAKIKEMSDILRKICKSIEEVDISNTQDQLRNLNVAHEKAYLLIESFNDGVIFNIVKIINNSQEVKKQIIALHIDYILAWKVFARKLIFNNFDSAILMKARLQWMRTWFILGDLQKLLKFDDIDTTYNMKLQSGFDLCEHLSDSIKVTIMAELFLQKK